MNYKLSIILLNFITKLLSIQHETNVTYSFTILIQKYWDICDSSGDKAHNPNISVSISLSRIQYSRE